jgi:solute carrier family 35 protein E1
LTPLHSSNHLQTKATTTAAADSSDSSSDSSSLFKALELGILFCLWFTFNIYFNIYNKQVLKVYHLPVTLTAVQFAIGTLLVAFMWGLNLYKRPRLTSSQVSTYFHSCSILLLLHLFCF